MPWRSPQPQPQVRFETLQIAIDAAVRAASQVPAMSERVLRLPLTQGGLGVPDVR